jgi:predicted O-methyltransferase YrrM
MTYPNWFAMTAEQNFAEHLDEYKGQKNLRFLQIGTFTGDASVWLAENVLTNKTSILYDVDTWQGSKEEAHESMDFADVERTYDEKVKPYHNVKKYKMTSEYYLLTQTSESFDFIYIDGDHTAAGVLADAVSAWRCLRPGGIMAFDDYTWGHPDGELYTPKPAINFFAWSYQNQLQVIEHNGQFWVRKNDN